MAIDQKRLYTEDPGKIRMFAGIVIGYFGLLYLLFTFLAIGGVITSTVPIEGRYGTAAILLVLGAVSFLWGFMRYRLFRLARMYDGLIRGGTSSLADVAITHNMATNQVAKDVSRLRARGFLPDCEFYPDSGLLIR